MTTSHLTRRRAAKHTLISFCAAMSLTIAVNSLAPAGADAAQFNATVRGKVVDTSGDPIEGVKVKVMPRALDPTSARGPIEVETDEDGNYFARNVPIGDSIIVFEFEGLVTLQEERNLRTGPTRIDVTMEAPEVPEEFVRAQVANEAYGIGADAFNNGDYVVALEQMEMALGALDDTPENAEARGYVFALIGASYSRQRMFKEAIEAFNKRLEYMPDEAAAHLDLAQALGDSGDGEAATPHFAAALALDPDDAATQYNVGVTMVNAGNVEAGIAGIEKAIELQPVYPLAYKNLGYAYARVEEYAKAVGAFEKYVEQSPDADDVAQIQDFIKALKEMIGE